MPKYKGESRDKWMDKCIPKVEAEGKTKSQAIGKCLGMFRTYSKKK